MGRSRLAFLFRRAEVAAAPPPAEPECVHCRCKRCVHLPACHPERSIGIPLRLAEQHQRKYKPAFPSEPGPGWDPLGARRPYFWEGDDSDAEGPVAQDAQPAAAAQGHGNCAGHGQAGPAAAAGPQAPPGEGAAEEPLWDGNCLRGEDAPDFLISNCM